MKNQTRNHTKSTSPHHIFLLILTLLAAIFLLCLIPLPSIHLVLSSGVSVMESWWRNRHTGKNTKSFTTAAMSPSSRERLHDFHGNLLEKSYYDSDFLPLVTRWNPYFDLRGFWGKLGLSGGIFGQGPSRSWSKQEPKLHSRVHFDWMQAETVFSNEGGSKKHSLPSPPPLFMHLTDIHIGHGKTNQQNQIHMRKLLKFQDEWRNRIKEVIITGDLTHGQIMDLPTRTTQEHGFIAQLLNRMDKNWAKVYRASQSEYQWNQYRMWKQRWLDAGVRVMDLKGNHDSFDTFSSGTEAEDLWECDTADQTLLTVSNEDHDTLTPNGGATKETKITPSSLYHLQGCASHRIKVHLITPPKPKDTTIKENLVQSTQLWEQSSVVVVALSAHPKPFGPFAPYNFWATLNAQDMTQLEDTLKRIRRRSKYVSIIVACHYPQSIITSMRTRSGKNMHTLMRRYRVSAFLSGHLHTLFDLVPALNARLPKGHMELQLADVKVVNRFRLLALDNGVLSWVDTDMFSEAPLVLVTNPKPAIHLIENEPFNRVLKESKSIRLYVIPRHRDSIINSIRVFIDNKLIFSGTGSALAQVRPHASRHSKDGLSPTAMHFYEIPYEPQAYSRGKHHLQVSVSDSLSNSHTTDYWFSLDGSFEEFSWAQRIALLTDWHLVNECCYFGGLFVFSVLAFAVGIEEWVFLSAVSLSMALLPFFVGEITTNHYAAVSSFGISHWHEGALLVVPTTDAYQLLLSRYFILFYMPMMFAFFTLRRFPDSIQRGSSIFYTTMTIAVVYLIFWRRVVRFYGVISLLTGWNGFWLPLICLSVFYWRRTTSSNTRVKVVKGDKQKIKVE